MKNENNQLCVLGLGHCGMCWHSRLCLCLCFALFFSIPNVMGRQVDNGFRRTMLAKGDSCVRAYDYYHAARYFRLLNDSLPAYDVLRKLAGCYQRLGISLRCAALLRSIQPDSVEYADVRALYFAYKNVGRDDSLTYYGERAVTLNPMDGELTVSLAAYYSENNKPERAMTLCKAYMNEDSTNLHVVRQYGYAAYLVGDYREAVRRYLWLDANGFSNYESAFVLGVSYEELQDMRRAYENLLRAAEYKDMKDHVSLHHLGKVCIASGYCERGAAYIMKAIDLIRPDSGALALMYKEVAEGYFLAHKYKDAARYLEISAIYAPDDATAYYNIAQMYGGVKDFERERMWYKRFLEKSVLLKDTENNRKLIDEAKRVLSKQRR